MRLFAAAVVLALAPALASAADYPEAAKLPAQAELPDVLTAFDGVKVASLEEWFEKRRPELRALFEHYMYGKAPAAPDNLKATVDREDKSFLDGKATLREVTITYGPAGTPPMHLLLITPNGAKSPAPVFVGLNFYGNHATTTDPKVAIPTVWVPDRSPGGAPGNRARAEGRGQQADAWPADTIIARGYALATVYCGDIAPDHPGHNDGVFPHYPGYDWGNVRAWAWGLSRAADYLVTLPEIDRTRLAVVGHSRLGKAAMVAGAYDYRFGVVIPLQAGCGGTAPSRGKIGESVERINTVFPHWFNAAFKTFNKEPERLPFDQHGLVALCAPRAVLFSNAVEDTWANPEGQFDVLKAAEPVYRRLNVGGLESKTMPETGKLSAGVLGYVIRPGKHSMTREDWGFFLDFADKHLAR